MDARLLKAAILISTFTSLGATYRTPNFVVNAPTAEAAEKVGRTAEHFRSELAVAWLGHELPHWYHPCPISVKVGQIGAGGSTTFSFDRGSVFGWRMKVQGSLERILDSVVPHEVSHTIFASHFHRPLPRWPDEGAATLIEHSSERRRQHMVLKQVWNTKRRMSLRKLMSIKEYPREMQSVLTLYAQGYSLADFLVQAGGRSRYLKFLNDAHRSNWDTALRQNYDVNTVEELETRWTGWVVAGSPPINLPKGQMLAATSTPKDPKAPVIRSQSPDAVNSKGRLAGIDGGIRRGRGLTAPNPAPNRKPKVVGAAASTKRGSTSPFTPAQVQAINDGWVPVAGPRLPRPAPLAMKMPASAVANRRIRTSTNERDTMRVRLPQ